MKYRLGITSAAAALAIAAGGCGADEPAEPARAAPTATPNLPSGTVRGAKPDKRKRVAAKRAKGNKQPPAASTQSASKAAPPATAPPVARTPISPSKLPSATSRGSKPAPADQNDTAVSAD